MSEDTILIAIGIFLIGFALGGAAVRYVADAHMRGMRALLRSLERELYAAERSKAVIR